MARRVRGEADGTGLRYETLEGPPKSATESVAIHAAEVAPGNFLVGWGEESGMTITTSWNLGTLTVLG